MSDLSVMTLGFLKETLGSFRKDGNRAALEERYLAFFRDVKEAGFGGVDIATFEISLLGEAFLKEALSSLSLKAASVIHIDCFADETRQKDCLARTFAAMETAKQLGSPVFMLVPETAKGEREEVFGALAESFSAAAERAGELGLLPVFEDFPDRSLGLTRLEEVKKMLERVKGLFLVFDTANMIFGGEQPLAFLKGMPVERIGYVHLKDVVISEERVTAGEYLEDGRRVDAVSAGEGIIPVAELLKELKRRGYRGGYCAEAASKGGVPRKAALKAAREYILNALGE